MTDSMRIIIGNNVVPFEGFGSYLFEPVIELDGS